MHGTYAWIHGQYNREWSISYDSRALQSMLFQYRTILRKAPKQTTAWDGVRNYQARQHAARLHKKG